MDLPFGRVKGDSARLFEAVGNDGCDHVTIEVGHTNRVCACVRPIEMGVDPVHGKTISSDNVVIDDDFLFVSFINRRP